jgi:hypothetical protein
MLSSALSGHLGRTMTFADATIVSWIQSYLPHHVAELPGSGISFSIPGLVRAFGVVMVGHWSAAGNG